jgi:Tfp pilus assembly PilM family ATPase
MSDFLAFDWERRELSCAVAQVSRSRVRIEQCFRLAWPKDIDSEAEPDRAGNWLKEELRRRGVSAREVLVSLPREEAVVRRLELPSAPDDELPALVRMQAATKSSSALDQLLLDFLPLPQEPGAERREVLMTTIPTGDGTRLKKAMQSAGLELVAIGISPVGAAEIAARVERQRRLETNAPSLVVARHGPRVEISLMRREHLVFTHSALLDGGSDERDNQSILAEITRATVAQQKLLAGGTIARAWVLGTEAETRSLCEALRARLSCEAETIDPLSLVSVASEPPDFAQSRAALAGPVGMLLARSEQTVPAIDFLSPRKPVPKTDRRKVDRMIRGGLAAAALLLALGWLVWYKASLDGQMEARQARLGELNRSIREAEPEVAAANMIGDWDETRVDWLAQLNVLDAALPGRGQLYLKSFKFDRAPTQGGIANVTAGGFAKSEGDVHALYGALRERNYQVRPREIKFTGSDEDYPYEFTLEATLLAEKAAPAAAARMARTE